MPQEAVFKSYEKYEIRILYFSCKYQCKISNKHLEQATQSDKYKGSQTKELTIYAATLLRLNSTQQ